MGCERLIICVIGESLHNLGEVAQAEMGYMRQKRLNESKLIEVLRIIFLNINTSPEVEII